MLTSKLVQVLDAGLWGESGDQDAYVAGHGRDMVYGGIGGRGYVSVLWREKDRSLCVG